MSSIVTRPRLPVAGTSLRSTPLSLAYFLTLGMANNLISTSDELFCFCAVVFVFLVVTHFLPLLPLYYPLSPTRNPFYPRRSPPRWRLSTNLWKSSTSIRGQQFSPRCTMWIKISEIGECFALS